MPQITNEFNIERKRKVSQTTIRNSLVKSGVKSRVAAKRLNETEEEMDHLPGHNTGVIQHAIISLVEEKEQQRF